MRRNQTDHGPLIACIITVVLIVIGFGACNKIENDCAAQGGHVKWLYGKNSTNYLCLSPDGKILG